MSDTPDLKLELVSKPVYLCGVREMVSQTARQLGFPEMQCSQIALAVDEALANVMKHGYAGDPNGRIWLSMTPLDGQAGGLRIVVEDDARQVEPDQIKGRDLEDIRPGGLGVHIIREVMDEAVYEKRPGKGMRLTMVKKRSPGDAASGGCGTAHKPGGCDA